MPSYRWLYTAIRDEILAKRLTSGTRLPATRDLAAQYGLSRGTIVSAFELLYSEGYLEARVGQGTFVGTTIPSEFLERRTERGVAQASSGPVERSLSGYAQRVAPRLDLEPAEPHAFRPNSQALDLFPSSVWAKIASNRFRRISASDLRGCGALGYEPLRAAIADYLNVSRGVNCTRDQVVVVSGVQDALDLAARLFVNPGDTVCIESPGYHGARAVFQAYGARMADLTVDEEGMEVRVASVHDSRLIYVTPAHQYPLGITMSLARRLQLLECVKTSHALIFEDDYDSEFRYVGKPLSALQGLDDGRHVLFAGSFSKVLFPSLRLGYIVVPQDLVSRFEAAKCASTGHVPLLDQAVLCEFITDGHFARHVNSVRQVYKERLSAFMESARRHLSGLLDISRIDAGLQIFGLLPAGITAEAAAQMSAQHGIEVWPVSFTYKPGETRHGLQIGFGQLTPRDIELAMPRLAGALEAAFG